MPGLPKQPVPVPTRTRREPAASRRNARFLSRCRAVARSRRLHRNPCHCRVTNRPCSSPPLLCWGPASHRFRSRFRDDGPQQNRSAGHPVRPRPGGLLSQSVRSPPARSFLGSDRCRTPRHSREGGGMRSYLYQSSGQVVPRGAETGGGEATVESERPDRTARAGRPELGGDLLLAVTGEASRGTAPPGWAICWFRTCRYDGPMAGPHRRYSSPRQGTRRYLATETPQRFEPCVSNILGPGVPALSDYVGGHAASVHLMLRNEGT